MDRGFSIQGVEIMGEQWIRLAVYEVDPITREHKHLYGKSIRVPSESIEDGRAWLEHYVDHVCASL